MRLHVFTCSAALLLATASSSLLHAQFQEPTKEELQMTSDTKAPGAAAVYLYREERTDDNLHYHSYYERIKVLTEKGKESATIRIPYGRAIFNVTNIQGRTIHADGTVIPLTAKPSDLVDIKTKGYQVNTMVFTLPSVEVGSILEYRLQIRYDDQWISSPTWDVQQPYFVHKAHYFFDPSRESSDHLLYASRVTSDSKVIRDASGRYSFDISDVPPIPNEDWMPPLNSINWRVEFYYSEYMNGAEFWQQQGKHWAKEAEKFSNPTKNLQTSVSAIVAPTDSEEQKAKKIYDAVMKLDNTSFTREKSSAERKAEKLKEIKDAEMVWNQKSGSANDLALLYVALARAAGLQAYPMQIVNRNRAIFDPNYLSTYQLDDYVAIVVVGGKDVFLDPGQKMCPYGLLHWKHTVAGGIRLTAKGAVPAMTPANAYAQNTVQRIASLNIDADGSVKGSIRFVLSGQDALRWRQLAIRNDTEEVKKQFNESMREYVPDGVQVDFDHFLGLDDYNSNLMGIVQVTGNLGAATGKHFFLPGLFFESRASHPFVAQDKRSMPIDVHYPRRDVDDITYKLPAGFSVESAPQSITIPWPNTAILKIDAKAEGDSVRIQRSLLYNFTVLGSEEYSKVHDFYQKVATADQQQLVLTRTPVAKGN